MNNILIYSHWRSGSNLLSTIFKDIGYVFLDDFHQQTRIHKILESLVINNLINWLQFEDFLIEYDKILNNYISKCISSNSKITLKVMINDVNKINKNLQNNFFHKIFLFREDMFRVLTSYAVASKRNVWTYHTENEQFIDNIDPKKFEQRCIDSLQYFYTFMAINPELTYVCEYQKDLVPFVSKYQVSLQKQKDFQITNIDQIHEIYNRIFHPHSERIIDFCYKKRQRNSMKFEEYIYNIRKELIDA